MIRRKLILLIDGSDTWSRALRDWAEVRVARSAADVVSALSSNRADVVIDLRKESEASDLLRIVENHPGVVVAREVGLPPLKPSDHSLPLVALPEVPAGWRQILDLSCRLLRTEGDLRQLERRLLQVDKLAVLGRLLAGVLHEINNPLDAVRRYVRLARETTEGLPEARRHLDLALVGLDRMVETLKTTLRLARDTSVHDGERPIAAVVEECRVESEDLRGGTRLVIEIEDPKERVSASLGPVLLNLVRNAYGASGGQGIVTIRARRFEATLDVEVEDQGRGFDEAEASRLFEPFFTTRRDGTGLGLAIARRLVERDGGTLTASSEGPGRGAKFVVSYPRAPRPEGSGEAAS